MSEQASSQSAPPAPAQDDLSGPPTLAAPPTEAGPDPGPDRPTETTVPAAPAASSSATGAARDDDEPPAPASFASIVELIQSGKPVPGIKQIPDTVLEGLGSDPALPPRRKPWEERRAG